MVKQSKIYQTWKKTHCHLTDVGKVTANEGLLPTFMHISGRSGYFGGFNEPNEYKKYKERIINCMVRTTLL